MNSKPILFLNGFHRFGTKTELFEAVAHEEMRRLGPGSTLGKALAGVNPRAVREARQRGWVSENTLKDITQNWEQDGHGEARAYVFTEFRRLDALPLQTADLELVLQGPTQALNRWNDPSGSWVRRGRTLLEHYGFHDWPPKVATVPGIVLDVLTAPRFAHGEATGITHGIVLTKAALGAGLEATQEGRRILLTFAYHMVALSGTLGHLKGLSTAERLLTELAAKYPKDKILERLLLDVSAVSLSERAGSSQKMPRASLKLHAKEIEAMRAFREDTVFADEFPDLYRGNNAASINHLNVLMRLGAPLRPEHRLFQDWLDDEEAIRNNAGEDITNPFTWRNSIGRGPEHGRLYANVYLHRFDRDRTLVGGNPIAALNELDPVLDYHERHQFLSDHELGALLSLKAEAYLCLVAIGMLSFETYMFVKAKALESFYRSNDINSVVRFERRMRQLEQCTGRTPTLYGL